MTNSSLSKVLQMTLSNQTLKEDSELGDKLKFFKTSSVQKGKLKEITTGHKKQNVVYQQPSVKLTKQDYELQYKSMQVSRSYKQLKESKSLAKSFKHALIYRDFSGQPD